MTVKCSYVELVPLHKLIPHPRNTNKHPQRQIDLLAKIIDYQGVRHPIIVSKRSGFIVAGHGRLEAATKLQLETFPVDYQDFENEAQEYTFLESDNRLAELAEHDKDMMFRNIMDIEGIEIEMIGIPDLKLPEIETLEPQCDEDEVPEAGEARVKKGDIWQLGRHRLMCGDSTMIDDVEKLMNGEKADMVFTDPPYGVSYEQAKFTGKQVKKKFAPIENDEKRGEDLRNFIVDVFTNIYSISEITPIYCWSPPLLEGAEILAGVLESGWHIQGQLIWNKKRLVLGRADYQWSHEICCYGYKGKNHYWCGDRNQTTVWDQKRDSDYVHPTQKPIELAERAILNSTLSDKCKVVDLFLGSGSTLIACEKTNRICFGMEIDPHYCSVILKRWETYTGKLAERIDSQGEFIDE